MEEQPQQSPAVYFQWLADAAGVAALSHTPDMWPPTSVAPPRPKAPMPFSLRDGVLEALRAVHASNMAPLSSSQPKGDVNDDDLALLIPAADGVGGDDPQQQHRDFLRAAWDQYGPEWAAYTTALETTRAAAKAAETDRCNHASFRGEIIEAIRGAEQAHRSRLEPLMGPPPPRLSSLLKRPREEAAIKYTVDVDSECYKLLSDLMPHQPLQLEQLQRLRVKQPDEKAREAAAMLSLPPPPRPAVLPCPPPVHPTDAFQVPLSVVVAPTPVVDLVSLATVLRCVGVVARPEGDARQLWPDEETSSSPQQTAAASDAAKRSVAPPMIKDVSAAPSCLPNNAQRLALAQQWAAYERDYEVYLAYRVEKEASLMASYAYNRMSTERFAQEMAIHCSQLSQRAADAWDDLYAPRADQETKPAE